MGWLCLWTWKVVSHEAWTMGEVRRSRGGYRMDVDFHHQAKVLPWGQAQGHSERALKGPRWALLIFRYCWHHRAQAGRWCSPVGTNSRVHIFPRNWKISIFPASWDILKTFFSLQWPGLIIPFAGLCTNIYTSNCKILCVCVSHSEGGNRQNRLRLESRTPSWAGLSTLIYMPSIYGNDIPTAKPDPPAGRAPGLIPRLSIT